MGLTWAQRAGSIIAEAENIQSYIIQLEAENEELRRENRRVPGEVIKPHPCTVVFQDADALDWVAKLIEETNEVVQEAVILEENADEDGTVDHDKYGLVDVKKRLSMELTDVITLCTSWLDALGCDEEARGELHRRVNEKNEARGYL